MHNGARTKSMKTSERALKQVKSQRAHTKNAESQRAYTKNPRSRGGLYFAKNTLQHSRQKNLKLTVGREASHDPSKSRQKAPKLQAESSQILKLRKNQTCGDWAGASRVLTKNIENEKVSIFRMAEIFRKHRQRKR